MMTREEVLITLRKHKPELQKKYPLASCYCWSPDQQSLYCHFKNNENQNRDGQEKDRWVNHPTLRVGRPATTNKVLPIKTNNN